MDRIVSISSAPYDGWDAPVMLESLARCGATHVEPAFIVGYTEPFDETAFDGHEATRWSSLLRDFGLRCHALSAHIDLGRADAVPVFRTRMDFARRIGARVINTNAAVRANAEAFFRNIEPLARHAEAIGLAVGLENPGDARPSLIDVAADGVALVRRLGTSSVRLNYDPGNTESHRPEVDGVADAISALDRCAHLHLKAVRRVEDGWTNVALGEGDRDLGPLREALIGRPELPVSVELPLRMRRGIDAQPWRRVARLDVPRIEEAVRRSLAWIDP